jgi:hypothetical protein
MDAIQDTNAATDVVAIDTDPDAPMNPPKTTSEGVAVIETPNGEYPVNHRLRAEAMARDGLTTDKDGRISDELIAATAERLDREEAGRPSMDWTRDKLVAFAAKLPGVTHESDANKRAILDAINAATAAPSES